HIEAKQAETKAWDILSGLSVSTWPAELAAWRSENLEHSAVGKFYTGFRSVRNFALSNDGRFAFMSDSDTWLHVWDLAAEHEIAKLGPINSPLSRLVCAEKAPLLFAGDENGNFYHWNLRKPQTLERFATYKGVLSDMAASPDGALVVASFLDKNAT